MAGTTAFVMVLMSAAVVGLAAVIARARVEIARIDAQSGQRDGSARR
ncbi:hypothetical protein OG909_02135 [Streptomyces sp. NBC_01754]|nr:hypothetical protein [Streptomyces sp. NBC_01754]WSC91193.1 hypothetical protein OG909_02135 [Streptomyces sp. NBC_01754]